jgi:hypothetical protein
MGHVAPTGEMRNTYKNFGRKACARWGNNILMDLTKIWSELCGLDPAGLGQ